MIQKCINLHSFDTLSNVMNRVNCQISNNYYTDFRINNTILNKINILHYPFKSEETLIWVC